MRLTISGLHFFAVMRVHATTTISPARFCACFKLRAAAVAAVATSWLDRIWCGATNAPSFGTGNVSIYGISAFLNIMDRST